MGLSVFPAPSTGAVNKVLKEQYFKADGTWTYPTSSAFNGEVEVTVVGAGGASGGTLGRTTISGNYSFMGAGGGGQVLSKCKFSVLNEGNQNVKVGLGGGGYYEVGSLFGGYSSFGVDEIANVYTDPALANGLIYHNNSSSNEYIDTQSTGALQQNVNFAVSQTWTSGTNPPQPPVGNTYVQVSTSTGIPVIGEYFRVEPSTEYKIGVNYHKYSQVGYVISPVVYWYDENAQFISNGNLTSYTTPSGTGTWDEVVSTLTTPSGARYGRIYWTSSSGGTNVRITGVFVTKSSSGITTVKSGYSSGYKWTGQPNSSFTVAENATLLVAQGGGGGWGFGAFVSGDGAIYPIPGHAGYTSGGKPMYFANSTINAYDHIIGGHGGGAGGPAIPPKLQSSGTSSTAYTYTQASTGYGAVDGGPFNYYRRWNMLKDVSVSGGQGGWSYHFQTPTSGPTTPYPFEHHGGPGEGIDGFGVGGFASSDSGAVGSYNAVRTLNPVGSKQYSIGKGGNGGYGFDNTSSSYGYYNDGLPNTGNGANGGMYSTGNGTNFNGARGGSGIVIVRWYE